MPETGEFLFQYLKEKIDKGFPEPQFRDFLVPGTYKHIEPHSELISFYAMNDPVVRKASKNVHVGFFFDGSFLPIRNGACYTLVNLMRTLVDSGHVNATFMNCYRGWDDPVQYYGQKFGAAFLLPRDYYTQTGILEHASALAQLDIAQFYDTGILVNLAPRLRRQGIKIILEIQNIDHVLLEQLQAPATEIEKAKQLQIESIKMADFILCRSEVDKEWAIKLGADPALTKTYRGGIYTSDFTFKPRMRDRKRLVFLGHMYYQPNENALHAIAKVVLPALPAEYTLTVIGITPKELRHTYRDNPRITFLDGVDDLDTELLNYDIALAPLREGSGTRLKLLDYLASGLPVISTEIGAEGLDPEVHSYLTIENNINVYASHIMDIMAHLPAYARRATEGRAFVERAYDWSVCRTPFLDTYKHLVEID